MMTTTTDDDSTGTELDQIGQTLATDAAETEERYLAISLGKSRAKIYEAEDVEGENEIQKTDLTGAKRSFTVSSAQFAMYARMGFHFVIGMDVTPAQFDDVVRRLKRLNDDQLVSFAKDRAMAPPE